MPALHHIDSAAQLIITTWEGEARDVDFISAIKEYQENIQNKPQYINYNEVVDLSTATNIKLTTEGIRSLGQIAAATDPTGKNKKLAIIVSSTLAYGLVRMYSAYRSFSKQSNKTIQTFKNKQDAFEWVNK